MSMDPPAFEQVVIGHHDRTPASPTAPTDPRWRGIMLTAPRALRFRAGERPVVPLCVYSLLDAPTTPVREPMRAVVEGATLQRPAEGSLVDLDPSPEEPPPDEPPPDPAQLQGVAVGGYRNHDLLAHVRLPLTAGVYSVHVEFRGVRSNTVTVELAPQP